ncbi:MAG: hypothetical protein JW924_08790 [Fusobacteriaceae bacterium]|nr:hypothetical protein [Fusobacteriaceae bacterium]
MYKVFKWLSPAAMIMVMFQIIMFFVSMFSMGNNEVIFTISKVLLVLLLLFFYSIIIRDRNEFINIKKMGNFSIGFTFFYVTLIVISILYTTINKNNFPIYEKKNNEEVTNYQMLKYDFEKYNEKVKEILGEETENISLNEEKFVQLLELNEKMHLEIKNASEKNMTQELVEEKNYLGYSRYFKINLFILENKKSLNVNDLNKYYEDLDAIMTIKELSITNGVIISKYLEKFLELLKTVDVRTLKQFDSKTKVKNLEEKFNIVVKDSITSEFYEKNNQFNKMFNGNLYMFVPFLNETVIKTQKYRRSIEVINYYENGIQKKSNVSLVEWIINPLGSFLLKKAKNNYDTFFKTKELLEKF